MHFESTQAPFHANEGGETHKTGSKRCAEWSSEATLGPSLAPGELLILLVTEAGEPFITAQREWELYGGATFPFSLNGVFRGCE